MLATATTLGLALTATVGVIDRVHGHTAHAGAAAERVNGHVKLTARDAEHLNTLVDAARARGVLVTELTPLRSTLEDVFVDLVSARDSGDSGEAGGKVLGPQGEGRPR